MYDERVITLQTMEGLVPKPNSILDRDRQPETVFLSRPFLVGDMILDGNGLFDCRRVRINRFQSNSNMATANRK
jgi:hypothetical protein